MHQNFQSFGTPWWASGERLRPNVLEGLEDTSSLVDEVVFIAGYFGDCLTRGEIMAGSGQGIEMGCQRRAGWLRQRRRAEECRWKRAATFILQTGLRVRASAVHPEVPSQPYKIRDQGPNVLVARHRTAHCGRISTSDRKRMNE